MNTLEIIDDQLRNTGEDKYEPCIFAYKATIQIINEAAQYIPCDKFPIPRVAINPGRSGGIRLIWLLPAGEIRLNVSPENGRSYIYVAARDAASYIAVDSSGLTLAACLLRFRGQVAGEDRWPTAIA